MSKPYPGNWVMRSALFVPGHIDKMLSRAAAIEADVLVLDLEDAVPSGKKQEARERVRSALDQNVFSRATVFARINSLESNLSVPDLERVACRQLHGIVYPNANNPKDMRELDSQIKKVEKEADLPVGYLSMIPIIETPTGVLNAYAIAQSSSRIVGLIFGCEDYLAQLQGRHDPSEEALRFPRAQVAMAARAAGIEPIDTPYVKAHDLEGLRSFARLGHDLGMGGMCALTPDQVRIINEVYSPTEDEVRIAREMMQAARDSESSERGVFIAEGRFIAPPTLRAAAKTLARHEAICSFEKFRRANR